MKIVERTKTVETKYNVYIACDGTEFNDKDECKQYDESAYAVLNAKFKELVIGETTEDCLYGTGSCDDVLYIVRVKSEADADLVLQFEAFFRVSDNGLAQSRKKLEHALTAEEPIIVGTYGNYRGKPEGVDIIGTFGHICEAIREDLDESIKNYNPNK